MIDYMLQLNTFKKRLRDILNICLVFAMMLLMCISPLKRLETAINHASTAPTAAHYTINEVIKDEHKQNSYIIKTDGGDFVITSIVGKLVNETKLFANIGETCNFHFFSYKGKTSVVGIYPIHSYDSVLRVPDSLAEMRKVVSAVKIAISIVITFAALGVFTFIVIEHAQRRRLRVDLAELFANKAVESRLSENQANYRDGITMSIYIIMLVAIFGLLNLFAINATPIVIYLFSGLLLLAFLVWSVFAIVCYFIAKHKDIQISINFYNDDLPTHKDEQETDVVPTFSEHPITYAFCEKGIYSALDEYMNEMKNDTNKISGLGLEEIDPLAKIYIRASNMASLEGYKYLLAQLGLENVSYTYDELNFYTKAVLYPHGQVFLFIESDIEPQNKGELVHNLVFQYDEVVSYWVQYYNIKVRGLDYFLKNRSEIITKNCKYKTRVLTFDKSDSYYENICNATRNNSVE